MNVNQIILAVLFISSSILMIIGHNILVRLVMEIYPQELQFRLSPSKRTIKKLKQEKATDPEVVKRLNLASAYKKWSWIGFGLILLLFIYKWIEN